MDKGKMIWGILFVLFGLAFLLANFGMISWDVGKLWPLILVVIGIGILLKDEKKQNKARRRR